MANPLTGDFDAVLQVSGSTVNRLLASMHQNRGSKPALPSFPHGVWMRIGDPVPIGGMRGAILAQVSVPHIDLIHEVSDRFWLEVAVRAQYTPDPGSVPIPEFINGTVRAQYRIDSIDPSCRGWGKLASDYLWIRAIGDTVSFTGTAEGDADLLSVAAAAAADPAVADARITRLARFLLTNVFEATPHKVSRRFRRGSMLSLNVGANRSVVAVPIGLTSEPSAGSINSIGQDLLEGSDIGIAIRRDFIIDRIQLELDAIKASFVRKFQFSHRTNVDLGFLGDFDAVRVTINYTIGLTGASAQWLGGMVPVVGVVLPGGLIAITIKGHAVTSKPIFNLGFEATQLLLMTFDASSEEFVAAPFGSATVNLTGAFAALAESRAKPRIQAEVAAAVKAATSAMAGQLSLKSRKDELVSQLITIDDNANAWFEHAVFTPDGVIVRGRVVLTGRRGPTHGFAIAAGKDGYSAFESWIPGGRVDSFGWSWKWFNNAGDAGSANTADRFLLRRPGASGQGRFGVMLGLKRPLPGLDGMGQVCLVMRGVQVHPVTGDLVPVSTARKCKRFGFDVRLAAVGRVFLREWVPGPRDLLGPVAESAIHEASGADVRGHGANTLVVRMADMLDREAAISLRDGLANSRRRDAGLVILILFSDGRLMQHGSEWLAEFNQLASELEAPLVVNEDVHGSWSKALSLEASDGTVGALEWRLISPTGGVTWGHSGRIDAEDLALALDDYLFRSPAAIPAPSTRDLPLGMRLPSFAFEADMNGRLNDVEAMCPPPPFGRLGIKTMITFVSKNSAASEAAIRKLSAEAGSEAEMFNVVVFDGMTAEELENLPHLMPPGAMAIPDPDGTVSRRFGVRVWPSNVGVNEGGLVTGSHWGIENEPDRTLSEEAL